MPVLRCPSCRQIVASVVGTCVYISYRRRTYALRGCLESVECECGTVWEPNIRGMKEERKERRQGKGQGG